MANHADSLYREVVCEATSGREGGLARGWRQARGREVARSRGGDRRRPGPTRADTTVDRKGARYMFLLRAHVQLLLQPPHVLRASLLTQWSLKRLRCLSVRLFNFCLKKENRSLENNNMRTPAQVTPFRSASVGGRGGQATRKTLGATFL